MIEGLILGLVIGAVVGFIVSMHVMRWAVSDLREDARRAIRFKNQAKADEGTGELEMKRKDIRAVVDYIARNHRCTFPSAWDTGEGIEAALTFAQPSPEEAARARPQRDKLVEEIKDAIS